jgi:SAM-dependent methyltransferase/aminoglycoside phosphotransferase (APT) family kinase protein
MELDSRKCSFKLDTRGFMNQTVREDHRDFFVPRESCLRCPLCGSHIEKLANHWKCSSCKRHYSAPFGILCLADHPVHGWGEFGEQRTRELLEDCERGSWHPALERTLRSLPNPLPLLERVLSPSQAGWWPLLNLQRRWRVLEIGSGWGAITFCLAPLVASVTACDLSLERLRFIKARAMQDGISNIQILCWGDTSRLPFVDQEFDLVILNGGLERVPRHISGSQLSIQRGLLREVARVLAPEGQLILTGHNRWRRRSVKFFKGDRRSFWGYKRLLRLTGFASSQAFIPLPDFESFSAIVDPARKQMVEHFFGESGFSRFETLQLKARSSLAPLLASSFGWISSRGKPQTSFIELLGNHLARELSREAVNPIQCQKYRVTLRELITLELKVDVESPGVMVKVPLSAYSNLRSTLEYQRLSSLQEVLRPAQNWPEIPKPLTQGTFKGVPYFVQEALPGFSAARFLRHGPGAITWKRLATDFIIRLHSATKTPVNLDEATWNEAVMPLLDAGLTSTEENTDVNATQITEFLVQELVGRSWPFVVNHGDYSPGNLLFDRKGQRLLGVIDWERALLHSLPLVDLLHVLLSGGAEATRARLCDLFGKVLLEGLDAEDRQLVDRYLQGLGFKVTSSQLRAFLLLDWLLRVSMWVSPRESPWYGKVFWLQRDIEPSERWMKQLFGQRPRGH